MNNLDCTSMDVDLAECDEQKLQIGMLGDWTGQDKSWCQADRITLRWSKRNMVGLTRMQKTSCWVRLRHLPIDSHQRVQATTNDHKDVSKHVDLLLSPTVQLVKLFEYRRSIRNFELLCYICMTIYSHVSYLFHSGSLIILVTLWQSILNRQSRLVPVPFSLDVRDTRYVPLVTHLPKRNGPPRGIDLPTVSPVSPFLLASS